MQLIDWKPVTLLEKELQRIFRLFLKKISCKALPENL